VLEAFIDWQMCVSQRSFISATDEVVTRCEDNNDNLLLAGDSDRSCASSDGHHAQDMLPVRHLREPDRNDPAQCQCYGVQLRTLQ
jgi:hypothetical protein